MLTETLRLKCKQIKTWHVNYQYEYIITTVSINITGPTIMGDVEPNVQRHVKTQLETSRLVYIFL